MATTDEIDIQSLKKGDVLDVERLQQLSGHKYGTDAFSLWLMSRCQHIQTELNNIGKPYVCRTHKGCIEILEDDAASRYASRRCASSLRSFRRGLRMFEMVDTRKLDDEQRARHTRHHQVAAAVSAGIENARLQLTLNGHKRSVPGLLGVE